VVGENPSGLLRKKKNSRDEIFFKHLLALGDWWRMWKGKMLWAPGRWGSAQEIRTPKIGGGLVGSEKKPCFPVGRCTKSACIFRKEMFLPRGGLGGGLL